MEGNLKMEEIRLSKKVYALDCIDVVAEIYRNNLLVGSKEFNILSESPFDSLKSDERRRKNNFLKANKWADKYLEQMKKYENHPKALLMINKSKEGN
jgi:hypothetical protein